MALLAVSSARAGTVPVGDIYRSLALAGDDAVWGTMTWPEARARIWLAPPGGPTKLLYEAADEGCETYPVDIAASSTAIAAMVSTGWREGCHGSGGPGLLVWDRNGKRVAVPQEPASAGDGQCWPRDVDMDGDRLAVAWNCAWQLDAPPTPHVTVRDLVTGEETAVRFDSALPVSISAEVALAGRYVAVHLWGWQENSGSKVPVWDLEADREAFRVDLTGLYGSENNSDTSLDIDRDGLLVIAGVTSWYSTDVVLASPTMVPQRVNHEVLRPWWKPRVTVVGGEIAANFGDPARARPGIVRASDGRWLPIGNGRQGRIAFNGARVAWTEGRWLRNETVADAIHWPDPPPAPAAPVTTTTPPIPKPTKRCRVPKLRGATLAKARTRLKAAGCRLGRVSHRSARASRHPARVLRQSPRAGRRMKAGAKVRVTVGRSARASRVR